MNNRRRGGNADLIAVALVALLGAIGPHPSVWADSHFRLARLQWTEMACAQEPIRALLAVFGG